MKKIFCWLLLFQTLLLSCKSNEENADEEVAAEDVQTPVTITNIETESLSQYQELNAISTYLQSSYIKATAVGYIKTVNVKAGTFIRAGQLAFVLQTKEAKALGNTINQLDPSFHFSGIIKIYATQSGYVTSLDHQVGDYVQDGDQLAVVSNTNSFGFLLNLPYELKPYLNYNKTMDIILPDKTVLKGTVAHIMPAVDSVSQTLGVLLRVHESSAIPQNLVGKVRIVTQSKTGVPSLQKEAVLTDESQSNFWVMKMIDSVTAVRVPVVTGLESGDRVEIVQPVFSANDKIVLKGNYGLPDTAKVKITRE